MDLPAGPPAERRRGVAAGTVRRAGEGPPLAVGRGSRGGAAARRWPCPEEAARARGAERQRRWWSGREKCDCVLTIGAGEMGTKRKSLLTRGKRQFAFRKCMLLLESV